MVTIFVPQSTLVPANQVAIQTALDNLPAGSTIRIDKGVIDLTESGELGLFSAGKNRMRVIGSGMDTVFKLPAAGAPTNTANAFINFGDGFSITNLPALAAGTYSRGSDLISFGSAHGLAVGDLFFISTDTGEQIYQVKAVTSATQVQTVDVLAQNVTNTAVINNYKIVNPITDWDISEFAIDGNGNPDSPRGLRVVNALRCKVHDIYGTGVEEGIFWGENLYGCDVHNITAELSGSAANAAIQLTAVNQGKVTNLRALRSAGFGIAIFWPRHTEFTNISSEAANGRGVKFQASRYCVGNNLRGNGSLYTGVTIASNNSTLDTSADNVWSNIQAHNNQQDGFYASSSGMVRTIVQGIRAELNNRVASTHYDIALIADALGIVRPTVIGAMYGTISNALEAHLLGAMPIVGGVPSPELRATGRMDFQGGYRTAGTGVASQAGGLLLSLPDAETCDWTWRRAVPDDLLAGAATLHVKWSTPAAGALNARLGFFVGQNEVGAVSAGTNKLNASTSDIAIEGTANKEKITSIALTSSFSPNKDSDITVTVRRDGAHANDSVNDVVYIKSVWITYTR